MKKEIKIFISGVLLTTLLMSSIATVSAKSGTETIKATYNNIKMYVNGKEISSTVEPFQINGTTYVPLRVVSESLGVDVNWDGSTNSIYLNTVGTGKPYPMEEMSQIQGTWKNTSITGYTRFEYIINPSKRYLIGVGYDDSSSTKSKPVVYDLNGQYEKFTGTFSNNDFWDAEYLMRVYGDERLLYESPNPIGKGVKVPVELDVKGVSKLKFVAENANSSRPDLIFSDVVIFDPTLWK